ncbi:APC family permease [Methanosphaerula subterraneus]|uniref:APC family permease n=1 Tax=Methanosphaerula subterraneus TaxID=3350244 RepID=UPI003F865FB1
MHHPKQFPATLGLPQIIALYIGAVLGSGIMFLPGVVADSAGPASLLAWVLMSLLVIPMALTMGLLSIKFPNSGGVSHFVSRAFNPDVGSLIGWFFLLSVVVGAPVIALVGAGYACAAIGLGDSYRLILAAFILLTGILTNYVGMKVTSQIQMAVVVTTIVILVSAFAGSVLTVDPQNFTPFMPFGWESVGQAATLIFWSFLGWEAISHISEEFEDPERDVVKGTMIAALVIGVLYIGTAFVVIGTHSYGPGISDVSLIHLINITFGPYGMIFAGLAALFICIAPVIAYIGAACRLAYSLSITGYAPTFLSRLSDRFQTPVGGLWFLAVCFTIMLWIFNSGVLSLSTLIQLPNATFILTYLGGCAAGVVLLKDRRFGMLFSAISLAMTAVVFLFVGWTVIYPAIITLVWGGFMMYRRRTKQRGCEEAGSGAP